MYCISIPSTVVALSVVLHLTESCKFGGSSGQSSYIRYTTTESPDKEESLSTESSGQVTSTTEGNDEITRRTSKSPGCGTTIPPFSSKECVNKISNCFKAKLQGRRSKYEFYEDRARRIQAACVDKYNNCLAAREILCFSFRYDQTINPWKELKCLNWGLTIPPQMRMPYSRLYLDDFAHIPDDSETKN